MTNTTSNKTMMNLQDSFLNHVRKENLPVVIYLVNGFQLRGHVRGFDNFTVIIENEGKQQLVYKHAVSTISPVANITIMQPEKAEKNDAAERRCIVQNQPRCHGKSAVKPGERGRTWIILRYLWNICR